MINIKVYFFDREVTTGGTAAALRAVNFPGQVTAVPTELPEVPRGERWLVLLHTHWTLEELAAWRHWAQKNRKRVMLLLTSKEAYLFRQEPFKAHFPFDNGVWKNVGCLMKNLPEAKKATSEDAAANFYRRLGVAVERFRRMAQVFGWPTEDKQWKTLFGPFSFDEDTCREADFEAACRVLAEAGAGGGFPTADPARIAQAYETWLGLVRTTEAEPWLAWQLERRYLAHSVLVHGFQIPWERNLLPNPGAFCREKIGPPLTDLLDRAGRELMPDPIYQAQLYLQWRQLPDAPVPVAPAGLEALPTVAHLIEATRADLATFLAAVDKDRPDASREPVTTALKRLQDALRACVPFPTVEELRARAPLAGAV